jgi:hypothetical protein
MPITAVGASKLGCPLAEKTGTTRQLCLPAIIDSLPIINSKVDTMSRCA